MGGCGQGDALKIFIKSMITLKKPGFRTEPGTGCREWRCPVRPQYVSNSLFVIRIMVISRTSFLTCRIVI